MRTTDEQQLNRRDFLQASGAGLAIGHLYHVINDTMTATGSISSGVDLAGYTTRGLLIPTMGSGCELTFQISASGGGWTTVSPGFDFMSGPALTVGAAPWQLVEPESLKVFPATGMNRQL